MANDFSDYFESAILNWFKGSTFPAAPTNLYASLHSAGPDEDGSPTNELTSDGSYARVAIPVADWSSITQDGGLATITNDEPVVFPTATANYSGTATHFCISDASTSGNLIICGELATPRAILNGDVDPTFAPGSLTVQVG
ncbi:MAG: hypothetical protein MOGMAGMI_01851 [Candidatus Omnitrophica bacterium]|nr:hypothetical protein [Candidatus Omnitrophota bacterium]